MNESDDIAVFVVGHTNAGRQREPVGGLVTSGS